MVAYLGEINQRTSPTRARRPDLRRRRAANQRIGDMATIPHQIPSLPPASTRLVPAASVLERVGGDLADGEHGSAALSDRSAARLARR
jgi:hypothetical protein